MTSPSGVSQAEVPLYVNTRTRSRYFAAITAMSCVQMIFWCYLSYASFTDLKLISAQTSSKDKPKNSSIKWSMGLSAAALSVGSFFTATALMYPQRIVRQMSYLPKKEVVKIGVFTPFGKHKDVQVPLTTIKCKGTRISHKHLSLKVKGYPLHYIVDHQGTFQSPKLFDTLIGTRQ